MPRVRSTFRAELLRAGIALGAAGGCGGAPRSEEATSGETSVGSGATAGDRAPQAIVAKIRTGSVARPSLDPEFAARLREVDRLIEAKRIEAGVPGVALAIVRGDRIVHSATFGKRDVEKNLPVTDQTLFAIASSSKAFTGLAVLMAVEAGKISLDDSPRKCLPYFRMHDPETDARITVRDLLIHTSGLPRTDLAWGISELSREQVIRLAGIARPQAALREQWNYQNVMFAAAGECAGAAFGTTFEDLVAKRIFAPLEMNGSNFYVDATTASGDHAMGYDIVRDEHGAVDGVVSTPMMRVDGIGGAGNINSSVSDMARWLQFVMTGASTTGAPLVGADTRDEWTKPQFEISSGRSYGLGWFIDTWEGERRIHHGGNLPGFAAMVAMLPEHGLGYVMLTNATHAPIRDGVLDMVFSLALPPEKADKVLQKYRSKQRAPLEQPASERSAAEQVSLSTDLVGYYHDPKRRIEARIESMGEPPERLRLVAMGQPPQTLRHISEGLLGFEGQAESYSLTVGRKNGHVDSLEVNLPGTRLSLQRLPERRPPRISASPLMQRVIAAHGAKRLERLESMRLRGRATLPNEGLEGNVDLLRRAPNQQAQYIELTAFGAPIARIGESYDGSVGTSVAGIRPPEKVHGKELGRVRLDADFNQLLHWKALFPQVRVSRRHLVDGEEAYVVEKTTTSGDRVTDYYSTRSFLLLRRDTDTVLGSTGIAAVRVEHFADYRRVNGVMIAHRIRQISHPGSSETVFTIHAVELDPPLGDSDFRAGGDFVAPEPIKLSAVPATGS